MKLIVQVEEDGTFVYFESDEHFAKAENERVNLQHLTVEDLDAECRMESGQVFILKLPRGYKPVVNNVLMKVGEK